MAARDRVLRGRPRPRSPLPVGVLQPRALIAARQRSRPGRSQSAPGDGARSERRAGPVAPRPRARRAGKEQGGARGDSPVARDRARLDGPSQRCGRRPRHHRRLRGRARALSIGPRARPGQRQGRAQPREDQAFHGAARRGRGADPHGGPTPRTDHERSTRPRPRARQDSRRSRRVGGRVRQLREGEPSVRCHRARTGRRIARTDGSDARRVRCGVVRDASRRDESRSDPGVHRRHAAFRHHAPWSSYWPRIRRCTERAS